MIPLDQRGIVGPVSLPDRMQIALSRKTVPAAPQSRNERAASGGKSSSFTRGRKCGGPCRYSASETNCERSCCGSLPRCATYQSHIWVNAACASSDPRRFLSTSARMFLRCAIGNIQISVIPAGIHRRQHHEQRLVGIERDWSWSVRQTQRRQQPDQSRHEEPSKPKI